MPAVNADPLVIAGKEFRSRLILGSGKFPDVESMTRAYEAAGAEMITVALRRLNLDDPNEKTLLDHVDWSRYSILPNTAGARTADEAVHTARLARAMGLSDWIKLEVIPDPSTCCPTRSGRWRRRRRS